MKIIYSRQTYSFEPMLRKSRFKYAPLKVETYCIEDTMNREFLAPKQVFCIATKGNVEKIINHLIKDFTEEKANIGDNFYFCQVRDNDELLDAVRRFANRMNIIPIYFDKEEKEIQKFIDSKIPHEETFNSLKCLFLKVDYRNEDYNIFVMKELNEMDSSELFSKIINAIPSDFYNLNNN